MKNLFVFTLFLVLLIAFPVNAYAEHVFNPKAYAQYLDISQLEAEKFEFEFDETSYYVYYGYHGSMDDSMSEDVGDPVVADMLINQDRKSIEVILEEVPEKTDFWLRIPFKVLTAENEKFQVLINGVDTGYDLMKMPDAYVIGMIISEDTTHVEVVGTHVIPEFGTYAVMILVVSIVGLVFFARKFSFGNSLTRIN